MKIITLIALFFIPFSSVFAQTNSKKKMGSSGDLAASISRGGVLYKQHCLVCHQSDGGGVPNMNPPLSQTSYVTGDKTRLIKVVLNGFKESVEIDGQTYSNHMPAQNMIKDQDIADILTYVRNSFGNKASAVKLAEVKAARAKNKGK